MSQLKLDGHVGINHRRVYRVMGDAGSLLFQQGQKLLDTKKHEGQGRSSKATRGGVQMAWNCLVRTVNTSEWRLHWALRQSSHELGSDHQRH